LTTAVTIPPVLAYSITRLALFAATLLILVALLRDLPFLLVLAIAAVVSGVASYFLLARQRRAMAGSVAAQVRRVQERVDRAAGAEDGAVAQYLDKSGQSAMDGGSVAAGEQPDEPAGQGPNRTPTDTERDLEQRRHKSEKPDAG